MKRILKRIIKIIILNEYDIYGVNNYLNNFKEKMELTILYEGLNYRQTPQTKESKYGQI